VRATKLGRRLYVEVDFVVAEHHWDVDDEDRVRRAVTDALEALPFDVWANVELTTDRELAE
jgi:predicted Co/Zn/Cd cation transporter (cation efflux family)